MAISVKILDSVSTIEKNINIAIAKHMNTILLTNSNNIINKIKILIPSWIKSQPEMLSIKDNTEGSLKGSFGIPSDTNSIVETIASSISESLTFEFKKFDTSLNGGLTINIQPENFQNLLALGDGHVIYANGDLHWLDWLLTRGDEIIITDYYYNAVSGLGRTKLGNMKQGGTFRVPPQFSGTIENNFVTRALNGNAQIDAITNIIQSYIK